MNYVAIVISATVLIFIILISLYAIGKFQQLKFSTVKIGNVSVKAEIADTFAKQTRGLMFRENLPENRGMLFVFKNEARHGIWMMNMSFPIDIIWLDSQKEVVHIVENAKPCETVTLCKPYFPPGNAKYVLEVNAGFVAKHGIELGSKADFEV